MRHGPIHYQTKGINSLALASGFLIRQKIMFFNWSKVILLPFGKKKKRKENKQTNKKPTEKKKTKTKTKQNKNKQNKQTKKKQQNLFHISCNEQG